MGRSGAAVSEEEQLETDREKQQRVLSIPKPTESFLLPQSISLFVSIVLLLFMLASSDASQFTAVEV